MATAAREGDGFVLCRVGEVTCAIPAGEVAYVELVPAITPVPNGPPFVEGVALVRGQALPAVSLRLRLGLPPRPHDPRSRLVVLRRGERTVGLLVDSARELAHFPPAAVQPPPEAVGPLSGAFLAGVAARGDQLVLILDVPALLHTAASPPPDRPPADDA